MIPTNKSLILVLTLAVALIGMVDSAAARPNLPPPAPAGGIDTPSDDTTGPSYYPAPITVDQITHNQGNIITTINNFGYIGGYSYYGLPSGEWPRNSGHDYIAEICYWMGAVTASGDTLVANTWDDFQSIPSLVTGTPQDRIMLSTDTTTYYNFDPTDTIGAGYGNPARGWRVWDGATDSWIFAQNYNPIFDTMFDGGPVSVQESHYRFGDDAEGSSLMGLEMTHTVLQWNYCYNEDFMFVILEIENTSAENYTDFAFGIYVDMDIGGPDGTGENGRLGDLVAFDSTENLAWIYDEDAYDVGWGRDVTTGIMGTKYLETPDSIGMTAFRSGDWGALPDDDPGRFNLINSTQYDASLPPTDQYYVQCTRGITLDAGKIVRVVFAIVAGEDEADFTANAALAQTLYDNYFVGPEPPTTPTLKVIASDEKVYLSWNDTAQVGVDPLSGENDFSGYKLYRSDNQGKTWGKEVYKFNNNCMDVEYVRLAEYAVSDPADPIPHSLIDTGLVNGVEYWYCLVAVDTGASATGVDPLQSGFGVPESSPNIVSVTPRTDPAGFFDAAEKVRHQYNGTGLPSSGSIIPILFDKSQLLGADYKVTFSDTPDETFWHLINETTGDTVLANQTRFDGDHEMFEYAEGLRVVIRNADRVLRSMVQTGFGGANTTLVVKTSLGPAVPYLTGVDSYIWSDEPFRANFELRYTGDSTMAPEAWEFYYGTGPYYPIPFEVWNTSTGQRVSLAVEDLRYDGIWEADEPLIIVDYPYDIANDLTALAFPKRFSWTISLDASVYAPVVGDVLTIEGPLMHGPDDEFYFSINNGINDARARAELANIKVVPDPYYGFSSPQWEVGEGETQIEFQNLPDECTIRIYTLSGGLVTTLANTSGTGTVKWDLLSASSRLIASGIYIYHVESRFGEHIGRFAVVK